MSKPVRIAFLGGLGEIGRNCMAVEQDKKILLIDCGLMFPKAEHAPTSGIVLMCDHGAIYVDKLHPKPSQVLQFVLREAR